jgi:hypothetical protein
MLAVGAFIWWITGDFSVDEAFANQHIQKSKP